MTWLKFNESVVSPHNYYIPTYEECVKMCIVDGSPFYEVKTMVGCYPVSLFNYRLANSADFRTPKSREMRGICFVFNKDGSLYERYILLEKFFNINQVPESMYSIVRNYKIKFINNKEDGSIASFIKLPNGEVIGKSKMGFDNEQANGINRIYNSNSDVKEFVNWCMYNGLSAIFEYVSPQNRIVLRYPIEELILLRIRDNKTGKHIDIRDHIDKIKSIKIAPFEGDLGDLDDLIEVVAKQIDREGYVITAEDENGRDFLFKMKTPWYTALHGILSEDIYHENVIIEYILNDKIDDVLGQIPEDQIETHNRINKIISVIKKELNYKKKDIEDLYKVYLNMGSSDRDFAIKYNRNPDFGYVMALVKSIKLKDLSTDEIYKLYKTYSDYEKSVDRGDIYNMCRSYISEKTKRLEMAREWLMKRDATIFDR